MAGRSLSAKVNRPSAWSRLQPRERKLILLLGLAFFLVVSATMAKLRSVRVGEAETEIAALREALDLAKLNGKVYKEKLLAKQKREGSIADEPLLFSTLIEEAEGLAEVTVQNQEEQTPVEVAPGLRRRTTEFTLRGVTLEQLTRFLAAVEGKPGRVVLTQRMLIRSSSSTEDRINAEIELSTWERVAAEETP